MVRGNRDHIIVTGTYKVVTLKDVNGTDREFHLRMPSRLSVPKYFWKMYYDVEMKSGTVFIGLNNPYSKVDPNAFFCETIKCPGQVLRKSSNKSAIFCCTKDSFEKVYGKLDPMVFERTVPKIYWLLLYALAYHKKENAVQHNLITGNSSVKNYYVVTFICI